MTKSRNILAPRHKWTELELNTLTSRYANERTENIANDIGIRLDLVYRKASSMGLKKSKEYLASPAACRLDGVKGSSNLFRKGNAPWNKGMKGLQIGGIETRFKPGSKPINHRPVGSTRVSVDGYVEIKIAEGMHQWRLLHRENWKKAYGQYPNKDMALIFKDGNRQNCEIENLELITRADLALRNMITPIPPEVRKVMQLRGAITRQINKRIKNEQQK